MAVTPRQFRTTLLPGKTLDTFDMRLTGPVGERTAPVLLRYFAEDLGYRTDLSYIGLEDLDQGYLPGGKAPESVNSRWNYATGPVTPDEIKAAITALGPISLSAKTAGNAGKLFGSVTANDVAVAIKRAGGPSIDKRSVHLPKAHIKETGTHTVEVHLHPEVDVKVTLEVVGQ